MKCVVQRVKYATCVVENKLISEIGEGLLVLVGFVDQDTYEDIDKMVEKLVNLKILSNELKALSFSVLDVDASLMLIPNFTLCSKLKGKRLSFYTAGNKEESEKKYKYMLNKIKEKGVKLGFGDYSSDMQINLQNDGPVTITLES